MKRSAVVDPFTGCEYPLSIIKAFHSVYNQAWTHVGENRKTCHVACAVMDNNRVKRITTNNSESHAEINALFTSDLWSKNLPENNNYFEEQSAGHKGEAGYNA
jgi:pyrimidine deaminase RibD-like protein